MIWALTVLSLVGVVLNIYKRRECFIVWAFTNAAWFVVDAMKGIPEQAALQAVYFVLAIFGIWKWRKEDSWQTEPS